MTDLDRTLASTLYSICANHGFRRRIISSLKNAPHEKMSIKNFIQMFHFKTVLFHLYNAFSEYVREYVAFNFQFLALFDSIKTGLMISVFLFLILENNNQ